MKEGEVLIGLVQIEKVNLFGINWWTICYCHAMVLIILADSVCSELELSLVRYDQGDLLPLMSQQFVMSNKGKAEGREIKHKQLLRNPFPQVYKKLECLKNSGLFLAPT
ncbi:hypothetical protein VNO77_24222 [Canavalia gladiata]|uniref:Uncharacterized protein n=1 Tax=Canavalia gladiata TaxID=3824 RepID=A0AAN9L8D9_CANGL